MTLAELLARMEGVGRSGSSRSSKCPADEDRYPSLLVTAGNDRHEATA
jgi:hypothetical protein